MKTRLEMGLTWTGWPWRWLRFFLLQRRHNQSFLPTAEGQVADQAVEALVVDRAFSLFRPQATRDLRAAAAAGRS